jgi:hypothetical protein
MKMFNSPSGSPDGMAERSRFYVRLAVLTILLSLAFFQPGLWPVSALTAFILGVKATSKRRFLMGVVTATTYMAFYVAICIFALPFIHEYTEASAQWAPLWGSALVAIGLSIYFVFHGSVKEWKRGRKLTSHGIVWLVAIGIASFSWLASTNQEMVEWSMAESLDPEHLDAMPNSDLNNFRLLPQARARDFLRIANDDPTLSVSMPHMTACDSSGRQCWESSFHLKGRDEGIWYNLFFDTVFDVATVDPTNVKMNSRRGSERGGAFSAFFLAGPESWVVKAAFAVHNPFSHQEHALFWRNDDGSHIMLIPYISYRPTLTGVMVPYLAGVMSVNHWGLVNDMSPSSAKEKYPGVPFFPTTLARTYAEIYAKWHGGIWGRTVSHRDELRVSEPDSTNKPHFNKAPYIEVYEKLGWQEVIALEPNSNESKALATLLFFDASTGYCRKYDVPYNVTLNGPRQAMANSMQGNWEADWSSNLKVEPRPLIRNGRIYYAVGILTTENDEHPYIRSIIIDGKDMKPYPVLDHEELVRLMDKLDKGIEVAPLRWQPQTEAPSNAGSVSGVNHH